VADAGVELLAGDAGDSRTRTPSPPLEEIFGDEVTSSQAAALELLAPGLEAGHVRPADRAADAEMEDEDEPGPARGPEPDSDELDLTASVESDEIRDLALAEEGSELDVVGREVTAPPSEADQDETARIVTEAVETGATPQEIEANPDSERSQPLPSPKQQQTFSAGSAEEQDVEMNRP
jgi:N utilization substance protein A